MKALVTGASRGLGLGICAVMARRGDEVFAACRKTTPELSALGVRVVEGIDIGEVAATERLRSAIGKEAIDVVVCNAGINVSYTFGSIDKLDLDAVLEELRVNTVGSARTVQAVLPNLASGSKVILITTSGGTLGRNPLRGGSYGYRMSKSGINTFGFLLATELRPRGIAVRMISPGPVNTDMLRDLAAVGVPTAIPASQSPSIYAAGQTVLGQIDELTLEASGSWIDQTGKAWA